MDPIPGQVAEEHPSAEFAYNEYIHEGEEGDMSMDVVPLPTEFIPEYFENQGVRKEGGGEDQGESLAMGMNGSQRGSVVQEVKVDDGGKVRERVGPEQTPASIEDATVASIAVPTNNQTLASAIDSPLSELSELPESDDLPPLPAELPLPKPIPSPKPLQPVLISRNLAAESSTSAYSNISVPAKRKRVPVKYKEVELDEDDLCSINGENEMVERERDDVGMGQVTAEVEKEKEKGKKKKVKVSEGKPARPAGKSRKQLDSLLGIERDVDPPEKIVKRARFLTEAQMATYLKGRTTEVQVGICQRPRYVPWGKCTQCVAKAGGDSCRFRDLRTFPLDVKTSEIIGEGYFEGTTWKEEMTPLPRVFNVPLQDEHVKSIERTIAPLLLPLITRELRHVVRSKAIKREVDAAKHRAVCDFCSSTIFGGFFFCKKCGRDFCLRCEQFFSPSLEAIRESPVPIPDAARPRLLRCTGGSQAHQDIVIAKQSGEKRSKVYFHIWPDLQPVSRFDEKDLKENWLALSEYVLDGSLDAEEKMRILGIRKDEENLRKAVQEWLSAQPPVPKSLDPPPISPEQIAKLYSKSTHPTAIPIPDPAEIEKYSLPFMFIPIDSLDHSTFDVLWARGEPIVVDGVGKRFKQDWTPDTFIERFGEEPCYVVNCQSDQYRPMKIGDFFNMFKEGETKAKGILKLKDWPATNDFQSAYPDLYNDFCDSLPVPDYTRREGVLNLYSHFPPGVTRPDIGPKIYNAFAARENKGGFGSTRLHMDVADAINIMLYASPRPDGQPGCAVWDLFRAEDADKLRRYLLRRFRNSDKKFHDPIHSQLFYLDSSMRKELLERHGVVSWRVYQYPGQAVFIPAGCAHQVCNLADCIKIALDFVSPHNVKRCQRLTQDFRTENVVKAWKEDVLQLYNVMWYAWLNSREIRREHHREAQAEAQANAERAAHLASLQNGEHESDSNGIFPPIVSSIRDEVSTPLQPETNGIKEPAVLDEVMPPKAEEVSPKSALAQILLEAALARPDLLPPTPPTQDSTIITAPSDSQAQSEMTAPAVKPKKRTMRMKEMIKRGALPIDFAVQLARAAMGEDAEADEGGLEGFKFRFGVVEGEEDDVPRLDDEVLVEEEVQEEQEEGDVEGLDVLELAGAMGIGAVEVEGEDGDVEEGNAEEDERRLQEVVQGLVELEE